MRNFSIIRCMRWNLNFENSFIYQSFPRIEFLIEISAYKENSIVISSKGKILSVISRSIALSIFQMKRIRRMVSKKTILDCQRLYSPLQPICFLLYIAFLLDTQWNTKYDIYFSEIYHVFARREEIIFFNKNFILLLRIIQL